MTETEAHKATVNMVLIWVATLISNVTLSQLVMGATLLYTVLQISVLLYRIFKGKV